MDDIILATQLENIILTEYFEVLFPLHSHAKSVFISVSLIAFHNFNEIIGEHLIGIGY